MQITSAGCSCRSPASSSYVEHVDGDRQWTCGKGVYAEPVAEMALTLGARRDARPRPRTPGRASGARPIGRNLLGASVTILGGGGITESLIRLLAPFDCRITVVRNRVEEMDGVDEVVAADRYIDALTGADLVVLALALTPETEGILGRGEFEMMEDHAWVVNVARGRHIVTDDLVWALAERRDRRRRRSTSPTPSRLPAGHPLWSLPNCIITPHIGNTPEMAVPLLSERITRQRPPLRARRGAARTDRRRARVLMGAAEPPSVLDAAAIVGLLADDDRRKVVAAIELGAGRSTRSSTATGLCRGACGEGDWPARPGRPGGRVERVDVARRRRVPARRSRGAEPPADRRARRPARRRRAR